jgi:hypothetical protein
MVAAIKNGAHTIYKQASAIITIPAYAFKADPEISICWIYFIIADS